LTSAASRSIDVPPVNANYCVRQSLVISDCPVVNTFAGVVVLKISGHLWKQQLVIGRKFMIRAKPRVLRTTRSLALYLKQIIV